MDGLNHRIPAFAGMTAGQKSTCMTDPLNQDCPPAGRAHKACDPGRCVMAAQAGIHAYRDAGGRARKVWRELALFQNQ